MGEKLIKPYEISVWEDILTQDGVFTEKKIAVIGSNTMTGVNKVYDPVFNKKSNGEKTLSFSLRYRYFDPYSGNDGVINPFAALLVNERRIKLKYSDEWYEFIVKDHTESSDGLEWTYTCTDAFVLELSKNGYNITFDAELNNNQGTARELAKETLKDTDWRIGTTDVGRQLVAEPIYKGTIDVAFSALNTDTGTEENCSGDVYVFYSHVKNRSGLFVQFIKQADTYVIDDNNVITATNYRITRDNITVTDTEIKSGNTTLITLGDIETRYQAYRLVYGQRTTYDPIMERTVDLFKVDDREIYRYTDYTYTTSNVVMNYITNGDNFNVLEDGSLQGWNPYTDFTGREQGATIDKLELITNPELGTGKSLVDISKLSQIEGFLKVRFKGSLTSGYKNTVFNSGIENNSTLIESISKGQKFVFRWRAGVGNVNALQATQNLGLIVAKYTQDAPTRYGYYYKYIDSQNIILRFEGTPKILNNYVKGGALVKDADNNYNYEIDGVVQTPSTKYIYVDSTNNREYIWNGLTGQFEIKTNSNYLPYYYLTATADKAIINSDLTDTTQKFGIFIYTKNSTSPIYIQDIQLTRFYADSTDVTGNTPILIGNVPTATSNATEYYYLKPLDGMVAEDVETYTSLDALADALNIQDVNTIKPVYNEDSEKILSISASQSNCFNILQTIAETFECWVDLVVEHDDRGYITYTDGKPNKYVYLKEYAGKDNYAGFKYGINLDTIERTVNSDEIVTKLLVDLSQSDYVDEGFVSIANAPSNQSGESYILNFDYYYNQGLLDRDTVEADRLAFIEAVARKNIELQEKEAQRRNLEASLTSLGSNRNVYTELVDTARDTQTTALAEFEQLTGQSYEDYKAIHTTLVTDDQLTEEETIYDILGEIYVSSATINNYSGILSNIEQEYWSVRKQLRGSENYNVKIWVDFDANNVRHVFVELNDYLSGFGFEFGGSTYTSTVSKKYWDLESNDTVLTFTVPEAYTIETAQYTIDDDKVAKFKITCDETVEGVEDEIESIQEEKNALTVAFNNKYRRFIQEGTWNSTDYIDSELYYLDALQVSNTSAQPTVSYTINVVEISELDGFEWYSFDAGDKTYIEDTEFFGWTNVNGILTPAREEVIVSEVEWHLEEPDKNTITVQNYKTRFEDLFQRISATVQTVEYNEATYAKTSTLLDSDGTINQNVLLDSLNNMSGKQYALTSNGSVIIKDDVILVQNLINPTNRVIINSEGIRVSADGGENYTTVIDGQGINIGAVYTGNLNTNEIVIGNKQNPSFRWDKAGISAFKSNSEDAYDLQTYVRYDQYGLYGIKNGETFKAQNLQEVINKAHFAVTWDGFFIKNSYEGGGQVEITSDNDFRVLKDNGIEKIKIGALEWNDINGDTTINPSEGVGAPTLYGIRIKNNAGDTVFKTDDDGNLEITGTIYANAGEIGGMTVNADSLTMDTIVLEPGVGIYTTVKDANNNSLFEISDVNGNARFRNVEALGGLLSNLFVKDVITVGYNGNAGVIKSANYVADTSGWVIKSDGSAEFQNVTARGHIEALTGTLGQLTVQDTITVGDNSHNGTIQSYGYTSGSSGWAINSNGNAEFYNAIVRGEVNAGSGNFYGTVTVGRDTLDQTKPYIIIDGLNSLIKSSNYQDGAGYGWMINKDGDAIFNNITARGAIKTAVFEYAEIQAVGGIFIFRPSSTIKSARISENDLIVKVEKPLLFAKVSYSLSTDTTVDNSKTYYEKTNYGYTEINNPSGSPEDNNYYEKTEISRGSWCKISNYTSDGNEPQADVHNILLTNGLTHVYEISNINTSTGEVTLEGGKAFVDAIKDTTIDDADAIANVLAELEGGALIDMGRKDGSANYGIGVNSSDNTVNLPARAISLFETAIDETRNPRVTYNYRGILGTLPSLPAVDVKDSLYNRYMAGTQGIYTDNMYLGDASQYIAFYTDENDDKHLRISAKEMVYEVDDTTGEETTWDEYIDDQIPVTVEIDSNNGNMFLRRNINATLTCKVYKGTTDITSQVTHFTWTKKDKNGNIDTSWVQPLGTTDSIVITPEDVESKAVFICEVEF